MHTTYAHAHIITTIYAPYLDASGKTQTKIDGMARAVRYVEKIVLNVELRDVKGEIYPPFLDITYASANLNDYDADKKVEVGNNYILQVD